MLHCTNDIFLCTVRGESSKTIAVWRNSVKAKIFTPVHFSSSSSHSISFNVKQCPACTGKDPNKLYSRVKQPIYDKTNKNTPQRALVRAAVIFHNVNAICPLLTKLFGKSQCLMPHSLAWHFDHTTPGNALPSLHSSYSVIMGHKLRCKHSRTKLKQHTASPDITEASNHMTESRQLCTDRK